MRLFPALMTLIVTLALVPTPASAATTSCGTPTWDLVVADPVRVDDLPAPAPMHTQCTAGFTMFSTFSYEIVGNLTGQIQIHFQDSAGGSQLHVIDVVLGEYDESDVRKTGTGELATGFIQMKVKVRNSNPLLLGSNGAVGDWRVRVDYT